MRPQRRLVGLLSAAITLLVTGCSAGSSPAQTAQVHDTTVAIQNAQSQPSMGRNLIDQANATLDQAEQRLRAQDQFKSSDDPNADYTPSSVNFKEARNKNLTKDSQFEQYIDPRITGNMRKEVLSYLKSMDVSKRSNFSGHDANDQLISNSWEVLQQPQPRIGLVKDGLIQDSDGTWVPPSSQEALRTSAPL